MKFKFFRLMEGEPGAGGGQGDNEGNKEAGSKGAIAFYKNQVSQLNSKYEAAQAKIDELEKSINGENEKKMQENNQWKDLYEKQKGKTSELEKEVQEKEDIFLNTLKKSAIEKEALKNNADPDFLDLFSDNDGAINPLVTSSGTIEFEGVKEYIENMKSTRPKFFKSDTPPNFNDGSGGKGDKIPKASDLSASEILALQKKDPAAYNKVMAERIKMKYS